VTIEEIREWSELYYDQNPAPITDDDIVAMFEATRRYGPSNGWAGASGMLAAMLTRLIAERMWK
jgi:hypothetical protein